MNYSSVVINDTFVDFVVHASQNFTKKLQKGSTITIPESVNVIIMMRPDAAPIFDSLTYYVAGPNIIKINESETYNINIIFSDNITEHFNGDNNNDNQSNIIYIMIIITLILVYFT